MSAAAHHAIAEAVFDSNLIARYDVAGPRYTSYPTADRFVESFDQHSYRHALATRHLTPSPQPLSLYVHIPFCDTVCFYCACNKIATKDRALADEYLDFLLTEAGLQRAALGGEPRVGQLHLGGGTPTFLTETQMARLVEGLRRYFKFDDNAQLSIEIDPRRLGANTLAHLYELGFRRISMGVQDTDSKVQIAVNRVQPVANTAAVIKQARALGFSSVGIDLIYGLPLQSCESMRGTLVNVLAWRPDRIALYAYAHLPERFKPQRRIELADLPGPSEKLAMMSLAVETLLAAGYVYIGLDHFALPDDELSQALRQGRLHRDFMGYSTRPDSDLIGLGVSSIGRIGPNYNQNYRDLESYYDALIEGRLPVARGLVLNADDLLRRAIIQSLMCRFELDFEPFETAYLIDFPKYFAAEWPQLRSLAQDGLIVLDEQGLRLTAIGRPLARIVAMVFDRYLREVQTQARYSKVI